ncbi:hypothetical protein LPUS_06152 [Lasallia pustulata]|uniref:Arginase-like protein n=1 Tax=Lasallia pustulata TaxID=136370 RepID=A0A1W5D0L4_9LECA|nr:hypothetical protein LPUS_06152 [Lasallia pustulata]
MAEVLVVERRRKYHWPEAQLNFWLIIMLAAAATTLGIFAFFITVQQQLRIGIPWLFPYQVAASSLAILFLILILILISQRMLLPGIIILGSFILFVLWLTGLIETSIQLFGPTGSVNGNCQLYVTGQPFTGESINTLAWLEQNNICSCWKAAFAFELIGTVFLLWMGIMAWQVNRDEYD